MVVSISKQKSSQASVSLGGSDLRRGIGYCHWGGNSCAEHCVLIGNY